MELYGENTRSLLIYLSMHILGMDNHEQYLAASHIGRAVGICDLIKRMPHHIREKRNYIPQDLMLKVIVSNYIFSMMWQLGDSMIKEYRAKSMKNFLIYYLSIEGGVWLIHRMAAYANKHLQIGRSYAQNLPEHANLPLLLAVIYIYIYILYLKKC